MRQSSVLNDVRIQRASFAEITAPQEERRESEEAAARRRAFRPRPRPHREDGRIAGAGEPVRQFAVGQALTQQVELDVGDLAQVQTLQAVEDDGLVHAVQELRAEVLLEELFDLHLDFDVQGVGIVGETRARRLGFGAVGGRSAP